MDKEAEKFAQPIMNKLETFEELLTEIKEELEKMNEGVDIMNQYKLTDVDDAGAVKYYGYVKKDGTWIIERNDTTAKTYRYAKGDELWRKTEAEKDYANAWTNRATLTYFLFYEVF